MQRMAFFMIGMMLALNGCAPDTPDTQSTSEEEHKPIVLYTSVDDALGRSVVSMFEDETGIEVEILGDTEATKTTGLVTRLMSEKDNPRCDVWWSSEPMGTILLDRAGVLEPGSLRDAVDLSWPSELHAQDWSWAGSSIRYRVIAYALDRVEHPPTSMSELAEPLYRGRIGMARPQFGTTRLHMALLASTWGIDGFEQWLAAIEANNIRLYDGNASVVRAIAMGEIDIGLTDSDDVRAAANNGWSIGSMPESKSDAIPKNRFDISIGPTPIPCTVAVIHGSPNPMGAERLAAFLVSARVERMIYESASGNEPVNPMLRKELGLKPIQSGFNPSHLPDYQGISQLSEQAIDACERVLGP